MENKYLEQYKSNLAVIVKPYIFPEMVYKLEGYL